MALTIVNSAELFMMDLLTNKSSTFQAYTLRLFSNNATISGTSVVADLTQCALAGYAGVALTAASWSSATTVSGKASTAYPTVTFNFTNSTAGDIYGLYLQSNTTGLLVAAEKFAAVRSVISGDSLSVTLNLTLSSEA